MGGSLPSYITCTFSPSNSINVTGTAATTVQLNVQVAATVSKVNNNRVILFAMALPLGLFGFFPMFRRKRRLFYVLILVFCFAFGGAMIGCGSGGTSGGSAAPSRPPAITQTITLTTSGSGGISHQLPLQVTITN
jgi:hypothetical protein